MEKVLVLDAEFVQAYSIAKSLNKAGYEVIAASSSWISYGFFSHYTSKRILSPSSKDKARYYEFLCEILRKYEISAIIPQTNDTAEILSQYYESLEPMCKGLATMPWRTFITAHNKELLMDFCREHNIPHPRTISITMENIDKAAEYTGFPAMIKPNISVGARGITKVDNIEQLYEKLPYILNDFGDCTLQQYIDNGDFYYNVMIHRNQEGNITESAIIEIQRFFPINAGSSSFCTTVKDAQLTKTCADLLNKLDWHGFADFDVLVDKKEGFKIIEINPRLPASVHAAYCAGINFPELIVNDLLKKPLKKYIYKENIKLRFLLMDFMWFIASPQRFNSKNSWFKFWDKNLFYQDTSISDPLIFFAGLGNGLSKLFSRKYWRDKLKK